ncbi:carbohydrate ABC transporter permease [Paenibacillus sp. GCM10023248]|uniref:carbohydrate ABC transporter permease n=1 Tax=Bacillales TaxID=1385 RepID=UPI002378AEE8|nr:MULTISPECIES: carbohydrate ABC transporter permease [Bacillales]MDD9271912.1 carbohydrate ABC transporter permease [Paenibacillus sp. MAHUQ-63]MDR6885235.1 putative aldouronate transport system permease protein [Bacillus sp. 3255]
MVISRTAADKWFDACMYVILSLLLLAVLYPLYFVVIASISNPDLVNVGDVALFPKGITLEGYRRIFGDASIWLGYRNSLIYTVLGTCLNVILTLTAGYALSRSDLAGRGIFMLVIVFTMFFSGGLIPSYLLIKSLGMLNTIWVMILPNAVSAYNIIIARTFFQSTMPAELLEAAKVDGCSNTRFFLQIVIPVSLPIVAVMVLFSAVGHWNSYFQALIYLKEDSLQPLQIILRKILISNEASENMVDGLVNQADVVRMAETMKYGVIIVSSLPVLVLYPFLQKYFIKGVMIGSLKG